MKFIPLLITLWPLSTIADSIAPYPTSARLRNVISAVGPNWNGAGNFKAVLIREDSGSVALLIFRGPYDQHAVVYAPHIALTGAYWGAIPWLEFDEGGRLLLHSENYSSGRNKWGKTLTIIERNNQFIVSEFSFSSYDSQNPDDQTDCNINLITREMSNNNQTQTPFPLPDEILLVDWNEQFEQVCYEGRGN